MKTYLLKAILTAVIVIVLMACNLYAATKWKSTDAQDATQTTLTINGKANPYYKLEAGGKISLKITGPSYVKLTARAVVTDKAKPTNFAIISRTDGKKKKTIGRATNFSPSVSSTIGTEMIGESRAITYKVPSGEHILSFALAKSAKNPVYMRLARPDSSSKKEQYIAYLPLKFPEEVRINVSETEYIYYRANSNAPVELEVIGPTTLKVVSRLEFDHTTRGDKPYRMQLKENGKTVRTKGFKAKISASATYPNQVDKVIGKGDNLYFKVPEGKHTYQVLTPDSGLSVLVRFYLPEGALGKSTLPTAKKKTAG